MKTYRLAAFAAVLCATACGPGAAPALAASPGDPAYVAHVGCTSACGIAPVVSATAESNHVIKASAAAFYDAYVTTGATGGFLLIFDSATDPGNGAVTPVHCVQAPANVTIGYSTDGMPAEKFSSGVVTVFSTTGCFTETKSATAFFHARVN